ncbi:nucleoside-diphosphate-sugar epimerase [alpha proteobacterium HIMB114]|nr:nucleoside-diphosphate-sugar epimerase [alpha proteobacterium HIMB114]
MKQKSKKIFITGGAGYVGSVLIPKLLDKGHQVTSYDLMIFGQTLQKHKKLNIIRGDIRDFNLLNKSLEGHDTVIHLACISNDPSFELDPELGKKINLDSFAPLVESSIKNNIKKFIYASSSSVYGIKKMKNVTEEMPLEPLTDYSRFKADCEKILSKYTSDNFCTVVLRPSTVHGYSPRQRLDLVVNILTNLAFHKREISVFGGEQLRPNIHINDMVRAYELFVDLDVSKINGKIYNVGAENKTVNEIALEVKKIIGSDVTIKKVHSDDNRSYHTSSNKILNELNFKTQYDVSQGIRDLLEAFINKKLINTFDNDNFFNVKKMMSLHLK